MKTVQRNQFVCVPTNGLYDSSIHFQCLRFTRRCTNGGSSKASHTIIQMQRFPTWALNAFETKTCVLVTPFRILRFKLQSPDDHIAITVDPSINRWMDLVCVCIFHYYFSFSKQIRKLKRSRCTHTHAWPSSWMQTFPLQLPFGIPLMDL